MSRTCLAGLILALAMPLAPTGAAKAQDASGTVMKTCTRCHTPKRICEKLGLKDRAFWEKTVTRMISHGARLDPADKPLVVDWLASLQSGAKPPCQ